jgi:hypothetical protein
MKLKIIIFMLSLLVLISMASAVESSLGTFKQNTNVTLRQMCASCGYNNISSVVYPDGTTAVSNVAMVKSGAEFTYVLTSDYTSQLGIYYVNGFGDLLSVDTAWVYTFEVTPSGFINTFGFYILILILSLGIIILGLWIKDAPITILGSLGLYFIGLYILFYGIVDVKDTIYTWAIGLIILGLAFYISVKSAYELIVD